MRMIPPFISKNTISHAEKHVFRELEKLELRGNPVCLHSLNLAEHIYKATGELDFVLIFSEGVYILEVKGGGIFLQDGIWRSEDRWGKVHRNSEGPFKQANSGMHSLIRRLKKKFQIPCLDEVTFGFGVVFPDCEFDVRSVEWDQKQVLDSRIFREDGLQKYIADLTEYWHKKFPGKPNEISESLIGQILTSLRPDFELVRDLYVQIDEIEARVHSLTEEQYNRLDIVQHCSKILIEGGAGTGKTFLAAEISRRHALQDQNVLFLCYSHILANHLRRQLTNAKIAVYPIHRLMLEFVGKYAEVPQGYVPGIPVTDPWFRDALLPRFSEVARRLPEGDRFDVLVIDEGQDILNLDYISALDGILAGGMENGTWRIFYDPNHQSAIYGSMVSEVVEMLKSYGAVPPRLTINCRNTDPIILQTRLLTGAELTNQNTGPGPDVETFFYSSRQQTADRVGDYIAELIAQRVDPSDITILSPQEFSRSAASLMDPELAKSIKVLSGGKEETFPHSSITFSTVSDFKGLENRFVALIDIEDIDTDELALACIYVGMTRARVRLLMCLDERLRHRHEDVQIQNLTKLGKG